MGGVCEQHCPGVWGRDEPWGLCGVSQALGCPCPGDSLVGSGHNFSQGPQRVPSWIRGLVGDPKTGCDKLGDEPSPQYGSGCLDPLGW